MQKILCILGVTLMSFLVGCMNNSSVTAESNNAQSVAMETISPDKAKALMEAEKDYIILDVRNEDEYKNDGHFKNAVLIPLPELSDRAVAELKDKNQLIFVYCRSGRRSFAAAKELVELGFTNIKDIGGINNWPYSDKLE